MSVAAQKLLQIQVYASLDSLSLSKNLVLIISQNLLSAL